jgi:hypothetical protein
MGLNQKGVTLVELIVYVTVLSGLTMGMFNVLSSSLSAAHYSQKRTYEVEQARLAMMTLTKDLRNATAVNYDPTAQTISYTLLGQKYTVGVATGSLLRYGPNSLQPLPQLALTAPIVQKVSFSQDTTNSQPAPLTIISLTLNDPNYGVSSTTELKTKVLSPNAAIGELVFK